MLHITGRNGAETPQWRTLSDSIPIGGLNLASHFGMAGVATRFANYENVSRTDDWLLM